MFEFSAFKTFSIKLFWTPKSWISSMDILVLDSFIFPSIESIFSITTCLIPWYFCLKFNSINLNLSIGVFLYLILMLPYFGTNFILLFISPSSTITVLNPSSFSTCMNSDLRVSTSHKRNPCSGASAKFCWINEPGYAIVSLSFKNCLLCISPNNVIS